MIVKLTKKMLCFLALFVFAACGGSNTESVSQTTEMLTNTSTLNAYINSSIEIDQLNVGGMQPQDANLFVGNDPADNTLSNQVPTGGPASFIDWNDLDLQNHRLLDTDLATGKDPTSFPQSNECVGPSQVLSKMDLRYIAAANNSKYAYFAVLRSNNNGDAGYYWLFTKKSPKQTLGQAPCNSTQSRLLYDIGIGDVLLVGHFHQSGAPLLRVFTAKQAQLNVTAIGAVDFLNSLWSEVNSVVVATAVNTTVTAPGAFGSDGVIAMSGANLGTEVFAEGVIDLNVFTGGASNCGATYYGSVITRSSGAGGTNPDLKDLSGPAVFNFGSLTATASLTGGCTGQLSYSVVALGIDGQPLANPTCAWTFDGGASSSTTCSGVFNSTPGTHSGAVVVSDQGTACQATSTATGVNVYVPMTVNLKLTSAAQTCPSMSSDAVTYEAQVAGGTGQASLAWTNAGCSGTTCTVDPADTFCTQGSLQVTVTDTSGVCSAVTSETETFSKVTTVVASDN
jgi:hypothetical protein